jgi:hypothetical protein
MIAARILAPHPKLSTIRFWRTTTLPEELDVPEADDDALPISNAAKSWP